jgi:hypothetical protein
MKNLIACLIGLMLFAASSSFAGETHPAKHVKHSKSTENVTCNKTSCSMTTCPSTCPKTSCQTTTCSPKGAKSESNTVSPEKTTSVTPSK